ncbi:uncharacterized protein LOC117344000 isoform X1 [Pecten maximus]|uniref:uncharacterized protein LOC117344000 isoform X1 n=1 Tax=Pecten maximus TaxID=6579 RepID=UPI001458BC42|nr:uncharacterized protein LOC117344000 isoform X1 [Pecten maximus]
MIFDMGNSLAKAAAVDFGIQWACWAVAAVLQTEKFYDLAAFLVEAPIGSGTILYLALLSLKWNKTYYKRQRVVSWLAATWGFRLGLFLFTRILKEGQDRRFNKVRNKPSTFFVYWTIQGVWVLATLLPTLILNNKKEDKPLTRRDYVGYGLWATGFLLETIADYQKSRFRSNPDNHNTFINQGLWRMVQYPNYLGEIMMWLGLYLSSSSVLKGWEHVGVLSPIFVTYLLTNVSGIPLQQRSAMKKYGSDPAYLEYLKSTPKLLPFIW